MMSQRKGVNEAKGKVWMRRKERCEWGEREGVNEVKCKHSEGVNEVKNIHREGNDVTK